MLYDRINHAYIDPRKALNSGPLIQQSVSFTSPRDIPRAAIVIYASNQFVHSSNIECKLRIMSPAGKKTLSTGIISAGIQLHGAYSSQFPKKSYAIEIEKPIALLDMQEENDWLLNAVYIDRSLFRLKLSYDLFRSLSTPSSHRFASDSQFVEVFINDRYNGVYLLMSRTKIGSLNLRPFNATNTFHSCILIGRLSKKIPHISEPGLICASNGSTKRSPAAESGLALRNGDAYPLRQLANMKGSHQ